MTERIERVEDGKTDIRIPDRNIEFVIYELIYEEPWIFMDVQSKTDSNDGDEIGFPEAAWPAVFQAICDFDARLKARDEGAQP